MGYHAFYCKAISLWVKMVVPRYQFPAMKHDHMTAPNLRKPHSMVK